MTRVPLWDNARVAIIALVVIGHAIQRQTYDSNNALGVYLAIYAFHMPAFMLVSGYFSRSTPLDTRRMRGIVADLIVPYLIFQTIWTIVQWLVEGADSFNPTAPKWTLWFLLTLAIFRVALPYLALVRWPLVWAIAGSVAVGYWGNVDSTFSLSRTMGILPFFLLGWMLAQTDLVERWRTAPRSIVVGVRAASVAVWGAWIAVVALNIQLFRDMDLRLWFFYDESYRELDTSGPQAAVLRLAIMALAVVLTAAFLVLVPRRETVVSHLGRATIYVYLLHSFVLYPIRESGILHDEHSSATWLLAMIAVSLLITLVLSSAWVQRLFRPLVQPRARWLFRDAGPAASAPGRT